MPTSSPATRGGQSAGEQCGEKNSVGGEGIQRAELVRDDRRRVTAHGHETRVAQRKLPGVAVDEIQADRHDDADADVVENVEPVGIDPICPTTKARQAQTRQRTEQARSFGVFESFIPFQLSFLPSRPDGLTSRIKIKTANAMASR